MKAGVEAQGLERKRAAMGETVPEAIRQAAQTSADGTLCFVKDDGSERRYSFDEVVEEMTQRGRRLLARGLVKGDRLAMVLTEGEDFVLWFYGALSVGVVPVPMYPPLSLGKLDSYMETARRILDASGARVLLCDRKGQAVLWSLIDRAAGLEDVVGIEALAGLSVEGVAAPEVGGDDVAFLQFTSGSTATPKGVMVTHANLLANIHAIMHAGLEATPGQDVAISWLPLYHDMGLIGFALAPICTGVSAVFIPTLRFIKRPTVWMETMSSHGGTITFAPNFAYALATRRTSEAALEGLDLSRVRVLGCGAEPNHPGTLASFVERFEGAKLAPTAIMPCYGMAEHTLAITFCGLDETLRVDRVDARVYQDTGRAQPVEAAAEGALEFVSCGRPFPGHVVEAVSEAGEVLEDRVVGELRLRGPSVTSGYFRAPEATDEAFSARGLLTGDLGYLVDGELFVTGRKKDLIILNGRNHDPQSIEWAAAEVEGVRAGNVVAFTVPGERTERLVIVAETRRASDEHAALADAIRHRVSEEIFALVDEVALVGPGMLPKTSSGKLQRRQTRQRFIDGTIDALGVRTMGARGSGVVVGKHLAASAWSRARHGLRKRTRALVRALSGRDGARPM